MSSGIPFEYYVSGFFQGHGYLCFRGVPFVSAAGQDATDLDVFATRFLLPLAEENAVIDCKDKQRPKPYERIIWTAGVQKVLGSRNACVAQPRIPAEARAFGERHGIETLTGPVLDEFFQRTGYQAFGLADARLVDTHTTHLKALLRRSRSAANAWPALLETLVATGHPLTNLNHVVQCAEMIRPVTLVARDRFEESAVHYVRGVLAILFTVCIVRYLALTRWSPPADRHEGASRRLRFGDIDPGIVEIFIGHAAGTQTHAELTTPQYHDEVISQIEHLASRPSYARFLPLALDLYFNQGEAAFDGKNTTFTRLFTHTSPTELLTETRRMASVAAYALGLSKGVQLPIPSPTGA